MSITALTTALRASGNLPDSFNVDFYVDSESTPRTARVTANGQANNGQDIFIEHQYKAVFPADGSIQEVLFYKRDGITLPGDPTGTEENGFIFETNWNIGGSLYPCGSTIGVAASGDVDFSNASKEIASYGFKEESGEYVLGFSSTASGDIAVHTNKVIKQVDLTSGSSMNLDFTGVTFKNNVINTSSFTGTGTNLTGITLPSGLTSIGNDTFATGYSSLETVVIPNSVTSIGERAFKTCSALENITLGSGLQTIDGEAFAGCSALQSITMPNSVTTMGERAFENCSSLETLTLSNNLQSIPYHAFYNCGNLGTDLNIPASVTEIGDTAFWHCTGIQNLTLNNGLQTIDGNAFEGCTGISSVSIPNTVTTIGDNAFLGCTEVAAISLPPSVTSIGDRAFKDAKADCVLTIDSNGGTILLGSQALPNSNFSVHLTGTGFPINAADSNSLFHNNTNLTSVEIGENITGLQYGAFFGCANLETVTFSPSSTLSTISANAFYGCSISSIELPNGVTTIERDAFFNCSNLASITIPASVTTMGSAASTTPFSGTCGSSVSGGCTLTFKGANSFSGDAILPRSDYKVVLKGGVPTKNGTSIFSNDTNLTSVSYEGGTNLIANAFTGCSSLNQVTFQSYPTAIQTTPLPDNVHNIIFAPKNEMFIHDVSRLFNISSISSGSVSVTFQFKNSADVGSVPPMITIQSDAFLSFGTSTSYQFDSEPDYYIYYESSSCFPAGSTGTRGGTTYTWDSSTKSWQP